MKRTMVIGDIHLHFKSQKYLDFQVDTLSCLVEKEYEKKPFKRLVFLGDIFVI